MNTTTVYFYPDTEDSPEIVSIQYPGYPNFKVGDKITLEVRNNNTLFWDVESVEEHEYTISKIEHQARKIYGAGTEPWFQISIYVTVVW